MRVLPLNCELLRVKTFIHDNFVLYGKLGLPHSSGAIQNKFVVNKCFKRISNELVIQLCLLFALLSYRALYSYDSTLNILIDIRLYIYIYIYMSVGLF